MGVSPKATLERRIRLRGSSGSPSVAHYLTGHISQPHQPEPLVIDINYAHL